MSHKPPFVRSAYNYDMDENSTKTGLKCEDKSLAQQEFKDECDINFIADRYALTGEMPQVVNVPQYGDFTGVFDFQSAQNAVRKAIEDFMELPAKLRARFDNSPQKLLDFMENPDNRKEAEFLGLLQPVQAPPAPAIEPTPPGASKGRA